MSRIRPILSCVFALALCIPTAARAWANDGDDTWDHSWDDPDRFCADDGPADSAVVQQKLAAKFGVEESQIASLRDENLGYGEIDHTLTLAERQPGGITDENVDNILAMRQDQHMGWGQIAKSQSTTLGAAKREFPVQPAVEPAPVATSEQATTAQPRSLSRSGTPITGTARGSSSATAHGGKSSANLGSSSHSGRAVASNARPAPSGHAYGRGSAGSSSANGKAKGHK